MRSRPKPALRLQSIRAPVNQDVDAWIRKGAVVPGDSIDIAVELSFADETPVDRVTLAITTTQTVTGDTRGRNPFVRPLARDARILWEATKFPPGLASRTLRFEVPQGAPAGYRGSLFQYTHDIELHVDIPWWPDLKQSYELRVVQRPQARVANQPRTITTARGDAEPFFEITIDDGVLAPGDLLSGAMAIGNLRGRRCKGVRATLIGTEQHRGRIYGNDPFGVGAGGATREAWRIRFPFLDVPADGKSTSFRLKVPDSAAPELAVLESVLTWHVEFEASLSLRSDITASLPVAIRSLAGPQSVATRATDVGAGRWRAAWQAAGAPLGLELDERAVLELRGTRAGLAIQMAPDPDSRTPALCAELGGFDWGLDLSVVARSIPWLMSEDDDGFGKRYRVKARDARQALPALAPPLRRQMLAFDDVDMDDHGLRVRGATHTLDQPALGIFLDRIVALADALGAALSAAPPPPAVVSSLDGYARFAAACSGRLVRGSLSIADASHEGTRFDVATIFDAAAPLKTRLSLQLETPLPRTFDARQEADVAELPEAARVVCVEIARSGEIEVAPLAISLTLPAFATDPQALLPLVSALAVFELRLRGAKEASPYR